VVKILFLPLSRGLVVSSLPVEMGD
jgi:hypothetical protein